MPSAGLSFTRAATALFIFSLAAASCKDATAPDSQLRDARLRWTLTKPGNYDIVVRRLCECIAEATTPVLVSVREGVVTSRTYVGSGTQVSAEFASLFPNVEGIFLIIDDALARNAYQLDVAYDATYGYPTSIDIDYVHNMVDDELTVQLSGLVAK